MDKITKLPIVCPQDFAKKIGYCGPNRYMACYWDPKDDALVCWDGTNIILANWLEWQNLIWNTKVLPLLYHYNFGNPQAKADYCFVFDCYEHISYAIEFNLCRKILLSQKLMCVV